MNRHQFPLILVLFLLPMLWACSSSNDQAPAAGQVHGRKYLILHASEARDDLAGCKSCHGSRLDGLSHTGSCLTCHPEGEPITVHGSPYSDPSEHGIAARGNLRQCFACHGSAPNRFDGGFLSDPGMYNAPNANCSAAGCHSVAGAHPTRWQGDNDITAGHLSTHRVVSRDTIDTGCAICHQVTAGGPQPRQDAPSCFSPGFTNSDGSTNGCHAGGPGPAHDMPYDSPDLHGGDAKADLAACQDCHGTPGTTGFDGGTSGTSCAACHPDAGAHPTRWQGDNDITADYLSSHRNAGKQSTACAICHDVVEGNTPANANAPSCFSASFTNSDGSTAGCHADGPGPVHDMPYDSPDLHGAEAKADLAACQDCHGTPGTTTFDGGISGTSCAACHPDAGAHPTRWQGSNDNTADYMSTHRVVSQDTIDTGCAICHQVTAGGPQPHDGAPSCFSAGFTNSDGSTTGCHASGPGTTHVLPYESPDQHGEDAKADLAACQDCHGTPGTTGFDGGTSGTACTACHPDAGAHPTRWQGGNDITAGYLSSHRNAGKQSTTCAICHDVEEGNTPANANAPSCFSASFTNSDGSTTGCHASGPEAPHPLPYTDSLQHGADAKDNLTSCVPCHATPANAGAGDNPRFNVAIGDLTNGCEDCHAANTAHPTPLWTGAAAGSHASASRMSTACALCHGASLNGPAGGGAGPACTACHTAGSPLTLTNCTSCHNWPPDGQTPAGNQFPNRDGAHAVHNALAGVNGNCSICHEGAGTESEDHFNGGGPASVSLAATYNAQSGAAGYDAADKTCGTTRCHGGQTTPDWFGGSVNVVNDCQDCHSTSSGQYNSATSGRHRKHVTEESLSCMECHDPTLLAADHFSNLATTGFEGNPWETLDSGLGYDHSTGRGCSVNGCHGSERW